MVGYACELVLMVEAGEAEVQGHHLLHNEFKASRGL